MTYEIFVSKKPLDGREIEEIKGLPVVKPIQVHGNLVAFVGKGKSRRPKADAVVTDSKEIWIGVLAADCLPIFLVGEGVVGVVHAGWRGTLKGIAFNAVSYINRFSRVKKAILGISICKFCYEVGEDVRSLFPPMYDGCFKEIGEGKFLFDLKTANLLQLKSAGVRDFEFLEGCTCCNNQLFYSYRKEKTQKRNLFAIRII
ncbi:MAG: polyphenol oxidase family protein [Desulfurobacteriaceae bacterium]